MNKSTLTMSAMLRTPIGDLTVVACEHGLMAIEFIEVPEDKTRQLAGYKLAAPMTPSIATKHPQSQLSLVTDDNHTGTDPLALLLAPKPDFTCQVIQQPQRCSAEKLSSQQLGMTQQIAELLQLAMLQLSEYFAKTRHEFCLPLAPSGTEFQLLVWQQLQQINYGQHCSYAEVASAIARPKAVRAVGAANGRNPLAIVVPCHRVIGQNGSMTGYAGGLARKIWLLGHEQS